uniref:Rhomboid family intramembrane serine protease n=1 Tax=Schlesneria paludicola TaxID=360056 RepID=A0A7C4LMW2_9PLAN
MLPLRDDVPTRCIPWINYLMIGICTLVFLKQMDPSHDGERLVFEYGMVPARVTGALPPTDTVRIRIPAPRGEVQILEAPPPAVPPWLTIVTCMFLHGGIMHIVGNMWFLYIFGDNVEDRYGHVGYTVLYLASGIAASLLHLATAPSSEIPTVGASGAISGVMGAYFVLFRHARVITLLPLGVFTQIVAIPAPFFLGIWFLMQLLSATFTPTGGGGVAFWAHVGGFVAGVAATLLLGFMHQEIRRESSICRTPAWQRRRYPW